MIEYPYIFRGNGFYPIIEILLYHKEIEFRTDALIDSGANISVFQGTIAEVLGIKIEKGEKRIFQGVGGKIVGYIHSVDIQVNSYRFPCKIAFSNELITSLNILGRDNFFKHYLITFDENNKKLSLHAPKKT